MTLPKKDEKGYLEIVDSEEAFAIVARKEDVGALYALFLQYGISCHRKPAMGLAEEALQFPKGMERAQVENILEGYKNAKGS
jgi:hypothetical protein